MIFHAVKVSFFTFGDDRGSRARRRAAAAHAGPTDTGRPTPAAARAVAWCPGMAYTVVELLLLLLLRFFALSSFPLGSAAGGGPLRFRSVVGNDASSPPQQQFKIVQFSDLHLDSTGDQCANASACITLTQGVMRTVLAAEAPVDLVVMAGDIACFTRACYDASVAPMREAGLPWAFINGNHDTASSGRGWQLHYDMTLATHGSRTQSLNNATSTYMLSVLPKQAAAEMAEVAPPAVNLWFFDSGDVECEGRNVNNNGCVDGAQLAWLRSHAQPRAAFGLAWVHIPLPEVMAVWSNTNSTGHCHDTVCCSAINPGLYSELLKRGDIHGVFSGHDREPAARPLPARTLASWPLCATLCPPRSSATIICSVCCVSLTERHVACQRVVLALAWLACIYLQITMTISATRQERGCSSATAERRA